MGPYRATTDTAEWASTSRPRGGRPFHVFPRFARRVQVISVPLTKIRPEPAFTSFSARAETAARWHRTHMRFPPQLSGAGTLFGAA